MKKGFGNNRQCSKQDKRLSGQEAAEIEQVYQSFFVHFCDLKDPRVERTRAHNLIDIIIISILAVIAGSQGWEDIENYGISKESWLEQFLELPNAIPSHDTFRRVWERLDPNAFEKCFMNWVANLTKKLGGEIIPIDGKTLKGSYDRNRKEKAIHVVSAWASTHRLVLGQFKVSEKSNEITAIPALLELLELSGCIITIDAMGTQKEIASKIIDKEANYVLALKANHPTLYQEVNEWFKQAKVSDFSGTLVSFDSRVEKGHHRIETRQVWAVPISEFGGLYLEEEWKGLKTVVMVVRTRRLWNKTTKETVFYLSSLEPDAQIIGRAIRKHWGIENQVHWTLDVTFAEDTSRIRSRKGAYNFSLLRRIALNALSREQGYKRSTRQKSNRAAMDNNYMLQIIAACLPLNDSLLKVGCQ